MGRSTHADRTAAWAAKDKTPGYRAKKIIPSADEINRLANNASVIKAKEMPSEIETITKED